MRITKTHIAMMICVALVLGFSQVPVQSQPALSDDTCRAIVNQALDTIHESCSQVGRNSACYGHDRIQVEFSGVLPLEFSQSGDKAPIRAIKTLVTSPMNINDGTWGLSLLKLQANLPNTMPGQNVTFLVYGDTSVKNASGDMQVFYFSSALGRPTCQDMPSEGIIVQSPKNMQVAFRANGVNIQIGSTILMQAVPHQSMSVTLLEGHATVSTSQNSETLKPGEMVSIPMGGASGLEASGPVSKPVGASAAIVGTVTDFLTDANLDPDAEPIISEGTEGEGNNSNKDKDKVKDNNKDGEKDNNNNKDKDKVKDDEKDNNNNKDKDKDKDDEKDNNNNKDKDKVKK